MTPLKKIVKIREGVFETNSSSSHSITLFKGKALMDTSLIPNKDGHIILEGGQFGWEWKKYNDALTKANYLAVACTITEQAHFLSLLKEVIFEQTKATYVIFNIMTEPWHTELLNYSYVDHCYDGNRMEMMDSIFISKDTVRNFVFNKNSYLFLGNDNDSCPPLNFYDNKDAKYKYRLNLNEEDIPMGFLLGSVYFTKKPTKIQIQEALFQIVANYNAKKNCPTEKLFQFCYKNSYPETFDRVTTEGKKIGVDSLCDFNENRLTLFQIKETYNKETSRFEGKVKGIMCCMFELLPI